jgi:hypothetical protein
VQPAGGRGARSGTGARAGPPHQHGLKQGVGGAGGKGGCCCGPSRQPLGRRVPLALCQTWGLRHYPLAASCPLRSEAWRWLGPVCRQRAALGRCA